MIRADYGDAENKSIELNSNRKHDEHMIFRESTSRILSKNIKKEAK